MINETQKIISKQEDQYFAKEIGTHLIALFYDVADEKLRNAKQIYRTIIKSLKEDGFHIVRKSVFKVKSPKHYKAVSIDIIFLESGLQFSTYPEFNSAILDFHSCRGENDGSNVYNELCIYLEPKSTFKQVATIHFTPEKNHKEMNLEDIVKQMVD
ncbi:MAG: S-adenosylmethionine decarboxylase [Candidatus Woesearchaeota archaeon]